jgi:two-component system LytT family response regulator
MEQKISAVLVDDETQSRVVMRSLLGNFSHNIEIIGEADNINDAYDLIKKLKPQLVFLDIQMPRGSGFNLLRKFDEIPFEIIFVTSFDKYAINAIKFSALDYLLKPVEVNDLKEAVNRAVKTIAKKRHSGIQVVNLLHSLDNKASDFKIAIQVGEHVKLVNTGNIVYIESNGSYSNIYTSENERFVSSKYVKDFEDYFGPDSDFIRIHRSLLINVKQIKEYSKGEPCIMEMVNGKTFEVARRKKQEVLEKLRG